MRVLALFSGGLDSMLAIKLLKLQNIDITALYMDIGFGGREDRSEILRLRANEAGADFKIVDIKNPYLQDVLLNPKFGYGKNFNPCIDCHAYMFKTALSMLESENANFIITGEVLAQRPMSQRKDALNSVLSLTGDENNLILRPLSAKLLKPTAPEINGWVDRDMLLDISGRGRQRQLNMAKEFGFSDYESPGGGCLLTLQSYSDKLKDALKFEGLDSSEDTEILKFGRHLRLPNKAKLIIGRDFNDNEKLKDIKNSKFTQIYLPKDVVGPYALISNDATNDDIKLAAKLVLTYARTQKSEIYEILVGKNLVKTSGFESKDEAKKYFVG